MADITRLPIRCEYPDTDPSPTEVTFRLSPSYGLTTGHEANEWFIDMMYEYEEFEVKTDEPGEQPLSFWTEDEMCQLNILWLGSLVVGAGVLRTSMAAAGPGGAPLAQAP